MLRRADPCRQVNSGLFPEVGQMSRADLSRERDNPYQLQSKLNTKLLIVQNKYMYLHVAINYTESSLVYKPNYSICMLYKIIITISNVTRLDLWGQKSPRNDHQMSK